MCRTISNSVRDGRARARVAGKCTRAAHCLAAAKAAAALPTMERSGAGDIPGKRRCARRGMLHAELFASAVDGGNAAGGGADLGYHGDRPWTGCEHIRFQCWRQLDAKGRADRHRVL